MMHSNKLLHVEGPGGVKVIDFQLKKVEDDGRWAEGSEGLWISGAKTLHC